MIGPLYQTIEEGQVSNQTSFGIIRCTSKDNFNIRFVWAGLRKEYGLYIDPDTFEQEAMWLNPIHVLHLRLTSTYKLYKVYFKVLRKPKET